MPRAADIAQLIADLATDLRRAGCASPSGSTTIIVANRIRAEALALLEGEGAVAGEGATNPCMPHLASTHAKALEPILGGETG